MAVLGRLDMGSGERLDLPDFLSIDSYTASDFKYLIQSFVGGTTPYILTGFEVINPQNSIGTSSIAIQVADSVVYYPGSLAGSFYYGLSANSSNAPLPLVPGLVQNATNFVYLTFDTTNTANDARAFWDPDENGGAGGEFSQNVNTETVLTVDVNVSVSTFPPNTIPICIVVMGPSVIESIEDARDEMFRLGTGGVSPNPFNSYSFPALPSAPYARQEPPTTMTSSLSPNAFQGGDKNISTLKQWMDVVMTRIKELGGTTFWYQPGSGGGGGGGGGPVNLTNVYDDALASTLVSKGTWTHSASVPGQATWNEDMLYVSLNSERNIYIRANTITVPNDYVAWINLIRNATINGSMTPVTWLNGSATVNGPVGAFTNLAQGDLIKQATDSDALYLRVEQFYALPNLAGGTTTSALAQSILLSATYAGPSGSAIASYTKGQYLLADINITTRTDASVIAAGGNFYWLAYRSDTQLSLAGAVTTQLALNIAQGNGQQAQITSTSAHGLTNGDSITITTGPYAGTYVTEVLNTTQFTIQTTVTAVDGSTETAFYATVTTAARTTPYSYVLETADHGFTSGEIVTIQGAGAFNGSYTVNVTGLTTFTIPVASNIANPGAIAGNIVVLPKMNVRTEFGTVKIVQGESIDIGADPKNLLEYIGMNSLAQTSPEYLLPVGYNALAGYQNFNGNSNDNLTLRVAQLTAMMADRVQDRGSEIIGRTNITSVTSGINQNISALSNLTLHSPASSDQVITLTSPIALPANSAIIVSTSRNGSGAALTPTVVSLGNQLLLQENNLILFYRFSTTTVYDWNGNIIQPNGHLNTSYPEDSQNRNVAVFNPGQVHLNVSTGLLSLVVSRAPEQTQITTLAAASVPQSSYFTFSDANDVHKYYVWYNLNGGGTDPLVPGRTGIQVAITTGQTASTVASLTVTAVNTAAGANVTATSLAAVITLTNVLNGPSTDPADGTGGHATTFTFVVVQEGLAPNIEILIPGSQPNYIIVDTINGLGTLDIADGSSIWCRIDRFNSKNFTTVAFADAPDTDVAGTLFVTPTTSVPIDQDVIVLWSRVGNNILVTNEIQHPDGNVYEEFLSVISGVPSNSYQITGPVTSGTVLQLPLDSRNGSQVRSYIVGSGQLEVFLNGQYLRNGIDWMELGTAGALSQRIQILQTLAIGDVVYFRVDASGAVYFAASSGGGGSLQAAYNAGRFIAVNVGQPVTISGASGKLLVVQGDMEVDGVIDPAGITFSQQSGLPAGFAGTDYGLYRDASDNLVYARGINPALNLSTAFLRVDGSNDMLAALNMGSQQIINLLDPTTAQMAATKNYVDVINTSINSNFLKLDGTNAMAAALNMGGHLINNVTNPASAQDAATKSYVDAVTAYVNANFLLLSGASPMAGTLNMGSHFIQNLLNPVNPQDAATKAYVDGQAEKTTLFTLFTNNTGSTINAGDIVAASQTTAGNIIEANNGSVGTSQNIVGVAMASIPNGTSGYVQTAGVATVNGTSAFTLGAPVYISSTNGQGTSTAPTSTGLAVATIGTAISSTQVQLSLEFYDVNNNDYNEFITVVSGAPANGYQITGPVTVSTSITLPPDSRNGGASRNYIVGQGLMDLYLNGQYLTDGDDWLEVGVAGSTSTTIQINQTLKIGDRLSFVINISGSTFLTGAGGGGSTTASNLGTGAQIFAALVGSNLEFRSLTSGSGISITQNANDINIAAVGTPAQSVTTKTANYLATSSDNLIVVNATTGAVNITLPTASTVSGHTYEIKKVDSSGNAVTITPHAGDTIDNAASISTSTQYGSYTITSDGTSNWWIT